MPAGLAGTVILSWAGSDAEMCVSMDLPLDGSAPSSWTSVVIHGSIEWREKNRGRRALVSEWELHTSLGLHDAGVRSGTTRLRWVTLNRARST